MGWDRGTIEGRWWWWGGGGGGAEYKKIYWKCDLSEVDIESMNDICVGVNKLLVL